MSKKTIKVPFDKRNGQPLHYLRPGTPAGDRYEYRDNFQFSDTLEFKDIEKGRHSSHAIFEGKNGTRYVMFLTELAAALRSGAFSDASLIGGFTFVKRGPFVGVRLVRDDSGLVAGLRALAAEDDHD